MRIYGSDSNALELWQWDTGRRLILDAPASTVDFVYKGQLLSVSAGTECVIPDMTLQIAGTLNGFVNSMDADGRFTRIKFRIAIKPRPKPNDYFETPAEILMVRDYVNLALEAAKDSGVFDGDDYIITDADYSAIADVVEGRYKPRFDGLNTDVSVALRNAKQATTDANLAAERTNAAITEAESATTLANSKAQSAEDATMRANGATENANTAADNARTIATEVQRKLENGDFKGDKGDRGDVSFVTFSVDDDGYLILHGAENAGDVSFSLNNGWLEVSHG